MFQLVQHASLLLESTGPKGLLVWQWLALLPLSLAAAFLGRVLGRLTASLARRITAHTSFAWDDRMVEALASPAALVWGVLLLWASLPLIDASGAAERFLQTLLRALLFTAFFWSLLRLVEVGRQGLAALPWALANPASRSLLQLGARTAKVIILVIATIAIVSQLG
ncbi:MAG TPA: hypothetical protein VMM92_09070, partial [Thermoanaerobaculia bacterium]|nr:hypothetical protein [Thermoanaerobaculia bacterium]